MLLLALVWYYWYTLSFYFCTTIAADAATPTTSAKEQDSTVRLGCWRYDQFSLAPTFLIAIYHNKLNSCVFSITQLTKPPCLLSYSQKIGSRICFITNFKITMLPIFFQTWRNGRQCIMYIFGDNSGSNYRLSRLSPGSVHLGATGGVSITGYYWQRSAHSWYLEPCWVVFTWCQ